MLYKYLWYLFQTPANFWKTATIYVLSFSVNGPNECVALQLLTWGCMLICVAWCWFQMDPSFYLMSQNHQLPRLHNTLCPSPRGSKCCTESTTYIAAFVIPTAEILEMYMLKNTTLNTSKTQRKMSWVGCSTWGWLYVLWIDVATGCL